MAVVLNNQGVRQMSLGKYEQAVELFEQAIGRQPGYATAFYNLGAAYFHLQLFEKAVGAFQQAYAKRKRYADAIAEIRRAAALNPNDAEAQFLLGNVYILAGEKQPALAQFEKIKLLNPPLSQKLYQATYNDKLVIVSYK